MLKKKKLNHNITYLNYNGVNIYYKEFNKYCVIVLKEEWNLQIKENLSYTPFVSTKFHLEKV